MSCHFHLRLRQCGISDRAVYPAQALSLLTADRHSRCKSRDVAVTRLTDEEAKPAILAATASKGWQDWKCLRMYCSRMKVCQSRVESSEDCSQGQPSECFWTMLLQYKIYFSFGLRLIRAVLYQSRRGHSPRCSASNQRRGFQGGNSR